MGDELFCVAVEFVWLIVALTYMTALVKLLHVVKEVIIVVCVLFAEFTERVAPELWAIFAAAAVDVIVQF